MQQCSSFVFRVLCNLLLLAQLGCGNAEERCTVPFQSVDLLFPQRMFEPPEPLEPTSMTTSGYLDNDRLYHLFLEFGGHIDRADMVGTRYTFNNWLDGECGSICGSTQEYQCLCGMITKYRSDFPTEYESFYLVQSGSVSIDRWIVADEMILTVSGIKAPERDRLASRPVLLDNGDVICVDNVDIAIDL